MTGWPMRTEPWVAALRVSLPVLIVAGLPCLARADQLVSNSQLLGRAVRGALDSALVAAPFKRTESVVILPAAGQASDWALENEMSAWLQRRVARLTFHGALEDSAESKSPADSAARASADSATESASRHGHAVDRRPPDPNADLLEYRVAELGVRYTDLHKSRLFGNDRLAVVSVGLRLVAPDGGLLWSGHIRGQVQDRVPQGRLPEVEDHLFSVKAPVVPDRSLTRLLEPAIVVGLVTGLIFLFYTNRN